MTKSFNLQYYEWKFIALNVEKVASVIIFKFFVLIKVLQKDLNLVLMGIIL